MTAETFSLGFFKKNLELQLRLTKLLQENAQRCLENVVKASQDGVTESASAMDALFKAEGWQAFATLPSQAFWRVFQQRVTDSQAISKLAIENQKALTHGLQQALQEWQQCAVDSRGNLAASQPWLDAIGQWRAKWSEMTLPGVGIKQ
jgi:hypothetical protein